MLCQILDWYSDDILVESESAIESEYGNKIIREYKFTIHIFCRDLNGNTVYIQIYDFIPTFYVEIEDNWKHKTEAVIEHVKKSVPSKFQDDLLSKSIIKRKKFYGFHADDTHKFLQLEFKNTKAMKAYEKAFKDNKLVLKHKNEKIKIKFKLYESNIQPMLRFMHIQNIDACGWITIPDKYLKTFDDGNPTIADYNYKCHWTKIKPVKSKETAKFIIASFDIECTSEDGSFPQPHRKGDKIIQIGVTFSRYGESDCYYNHIICLGKTDNVEDSKVEWHDTEEEVLLGFTKLLKKHDPDIVIGYNIFGFDFEYMMNRSIFLGINKQFSELTRFNDVEARYEKKRLSSSAMGDNYLKFYNMTGRIIVDLFKTVQRDYKLPLYKLDYVSSYFIREQIHKFELDDDNNTVFTTKDTRDLKEGNYINIYFNDGIIDDKYKDKKYKVIKIHEPYQIEEKDKDDKIIKKTIYKFTVEGKVDLTKLFAKKYEINWCRSKNDVSPNDIFRLFKGSSADRKRLAEYCKEDCAICNKLIDKLKIITNNLGMANVCSVPLSYIFLRGQSIKVFSLVSKKTREKGFLIPTLNKKSQGNSVEKFIDNDNETTTIVTQYPYVKHNDYINLHYEETKKGKTEKIFVGKYKVKGRGTDSITLYDKVSHPALLVKKNLTKFLWEIFVPKKHNADDSDSEDEEEDVGYEGACVFKPSDETCSKPLMTPSITLDYNSLYPSCIMFRNISHDTLVLDEKYNNLPGYIYHDVEITNADGTINVYRFAEKDNGERGIIPEICEFLLDKRNEIKNILKCKMFDGVKIDAFMEAIFDGLQLAYKLTANSVYGQLGASTSSIYLKSLAASVTATGREMLTQSKFFVEEVYSRLIRYAQDTHKKYLLALEKEENIKHEQLEIAKKDKSQRKVIFDVPITQHEKQADDYEEVDLTESNDKYVRFFAKMLDKMPNPSRLYSQKIMGLFVSLNKKFTDNKYKVNPNDKDDKRIALWNNRLELMNIVREEIHRILNGKKVEPKVIYGDTDSVFFTMNIMNDKGEIMKDQEALEMSLKLGMLSSAIIYLTLPDPLNMEFEKVLWPLILLTKKRYVGNLYSDINKPTKFYQKSMGIATKRRDSAPIVKIVLSGIIDYIINKRDFKGAVNFVRKVLNNIINEKYSIDKFYVTRNLNTSYSDRSKIPHAVLADRIAKRDPGNAPMGNDRMVYVYIKLENDYDGRKKDKVILQGDRIETPEYIKENGLKIDYLHYITNQIQKPATQFLSLIVENPKDIFDEYIVKEKHIQNGTRPINEVMNDKANEKSTGVGVKINMNELSGCGKIRKTRSSSCPVKYGKRLV